jgi:hypothetical protein
MYLDGLDFMFQTHEIIPSVDPATTLDLVMRAGNFLMMAAGIGAVLWRLSRMATRFEMVAEQHGKEINELKSTVIKLSDVVTTQAVQSERLNNQGTQIAALTQEIADLRRGRGFIQRETDGEYPR